MKVLIALIVALGLTSCAHKTSSETILGVAFAYDAKGVLVDAQVLGLAKDMDDCHAKVQQIIARGFTAPDADGNTYKVGCATVELLN